MGNRAKLSGFNKLSLRCLWFRRRSFKREMFHTLIGCNLSFSDYVVKVRSVLFSSFAVSFHS